MFFPSFMSLFPTLWRGPSSWGYGLPRFGVAPWVGDTDSHALARPLEFRIQELKSKRARRDSSSSSLKGERFKDL